MAERMPVAYPNLETSQINFSLPLRLAHKRSTSSMSTRSPTGNLLEVPCLTRSRAASAPVSPAYTSGPVSTHPSGSDSIHSPTFLNQVNSSNLRPRVVSYSSINRRPPPRLQLHDQSRLRADSTSTTSSLEASLAELEQLIEVLSTPIPLEEGFFSVQSEAVTRMRVECSEGIHVGSNTAKQLTANEPGPRWI
ncbi:hypothetical protein B0J17DRAFT_714583 [Rhizoctonia solani]|nr:hypothetical protein B0J17DRAFT_714583 [Rhizoctonia solani]